MSALPRKRTVITSLSRPLAPQLSHAPSVNQPLRFSNRFVPVEAIELERNQIKGLVLACRFELTAIRFGNYRSPQSIGSLEGADSEPFVVRSAVSIARHDAMYRREHLARNGIPATARLGRQAIPKANNAMPVSVKSALPPTADMYRVEPSVGLVG